MTASTVIFANTLAMQYASRLDGERLRRVAEADSVDAALKMLGDYGYPYAPGSSIDGFIVAETDRLIDFIRETCPNQRACDALLAPFWYNNVKLAYKSRFVDVPSDAYYMVGGETDKIAHGDYSDCDRYLAEALLTLDEDNERNPREIDLAITRAMYDSVLSCGVGMIKKYFRAEIDMKNILTAARMRKLGVTRDEFIAGGRIKLSDIKSSVTAGSFAGCYLGTAYEDMADMLEQSDFTKLREFESMADDQLYFMTDSLCARIATFEPFLNYYSRARVELKTIKTALVCIKTDARDVFYSRIPALYDR